MAMNNNSSSSNVFGFNLSNNIHGSQNSLGNSSNLISLKYLRETNVIRSQMMGANFNEPATSINGLGLPGLNRRVTHTRRTTITPLGVVRVETVVEYYPTQNPSIFPPNEVVRTAPPTENPSIFSQNEAVRTNGFVTAANPIRYFNNFTKNNGFSHTNMRKKRHVVNDGRIHSLPHRKFGPYRCPKCLNIFQTSQQFAAHAVSQHYKFESAEEKTRRRDARFNKRNVQQGRN